MKKDNNPTRKELEKEHNDKFTWTEESGGFKILDDDDEIELDSKGNWIKKDKKIKKAPL